MSVFWDRREEVGDLGRVSGRGQGRGGAHLESRNPYFAPDDTLTNAPSGVRHAHACRRVFGFGVAHRCFAVVLRRAAESLEKILHAKTMVVDGYWYTIGGTISTT